ncbi:YybH family protein [Geodermatophilus sp. FMUSA9-8]|uniref:YybH family protein n=1 Tax=Geodermatophilus sp. FMUSA9-8 TaxID=3120155 RepID=UPI003008DBAF
METDEDRVRAALDVWAEAVRRADVDAVAALHTADVVLFDVVPPMTVTGLDAYLEQWRLFWDAQGEGVFDLTRLTVVAGPDVAFAYGLLRVGAAGTEGFEVRLTVGLRLVEGRWLVVHEHHSVPAG